MTRFVQQTLLAAALAATFGVAGAEEPAKKPAAMTAPAAAGAAKDAKPPVAIDRNKISTMVGMDIGRGLAQIKDDIDIKVVGYLRCAKAAAPHMRRGGYGRIINIGGLTGRGSKQLSGMRNVAIVHMTKTLSDQLGPDGITVNTIHPGVVETPHIHELYEKEARKQGLTAAEVEANYVKATPIRRVLQPEEMGWLIAFLASPRSGSITGESLGCDGGLTRGIFL